MYWTICNKKSKLKKIFAVHRKEDDKINEIKEYTEKVFEDIKHTDEFGNEYWLARELMIVLEYSLWQRFSNVLRKAMENCLNSNHNVSEHFISTDKMINLANNAVRNIQDYKLSRYACYLIVLNCDPRKKLITTILWEL